MRFVPALVVILGVLAGVGCGGGSDKAASSSTCAPGSVGCACSLPFTGTWTTSTDTLGHPDPSSNTLLDDAPGVDCNQSNPSPTVQAACVTVSAATQHHVLGTTPDGSTLLVHRAPVGQCGIQSGAGTIWIYDGKLSPYGYAGKDVTAALSGLGLSLQEGQLTLDPDGLGIVGRLANGHFAEARRSASGATDFGPASEVPFAAINALAGARSGPAFSEDGSRFFFALGPTWYEAGRTAGAYPAPELMDAAINDGTHVVTGATADGLNVFTWAGFTTYVHYRTALGQPLTKVGGPYASWWSRPIDGCQRMVATISPGGCNNERAGVLTAK